MQWRKGMLRLWIVLSVVWCLFLAVQVYLGAAKGARAAVELARTTAEYECASKAADSQEQCVRDRRAALEVEYDATVGSYLSQSLSDRVFFTGILLAMALPPLFVLLIGRIAAWILRGFRGA